MCEQSDLYILDSKDLMTRDMGRQSFSVYVTLESQMLVSLFLINT